MASKYQCDFCSDEPAKLTINDQDTGDTQFVGLNCMPLLGLGLIQALPAEVLDATLAVLDYQPNAALKKARKAAADETDESTRTIATITETEPRTKTVVPDPEDDADDDEQQADLSPSDFVLHDGKPAEMSAIDQQVMANNARADDPSDPAPY